MCSAAHAHVSVCGPSMAMVAQEPAIPMMLVPDFMQSFEAHVARCAPSVKVTIMILRVLSDTL